MAAADATAPPQAPEAKPGGRKRLLVLVLVAVIAIAAIGIGAVILLGSPAPPAGGLDHVTVSVQGGNVSLDPSTTRSLSAAAIDKKGLDETANATFTWVASPASSLGIAHPGTASGAVVTGLLPGSVTVTVTATWGGSTVSGSATLTVVALTLAVSSNNAHPTIGSTFLLTVRVARADTTTATDFNGLLHFTSTDPAATLPPDTLLSPADAGVLSLPNVIVNASGTTTITATNASFGASGSVSVTGNHPPVALFTASAGSSPATVNLDASASNDPDAGETLSYLWAYGDGNTAQVATAVSTHTYASTGTFAITLTVSDNYGATAAVTHSFIVHTPPQASFKVNREVKNTTATGVMVEFNATASAGGDGTLTSYAWEFGDAGTASTANPIAFHNYSLSYDGKSVTVNLTVTNNYTLTNRTSKSVTVSTTALPPIAAFTMQIDNYTRTVSVDGSGSQSPTGQALVYYNWTWGDGSPYSNTTSPTATHVYATDSTFTISLTVVDALNFKGSVSHGAVVAYVEVAPVPIFNVTKSGLTIEANATATFDLNGNLAWFTWTWGDGSAAQTVPASQKVTAHTFAAAGLYQVTLVANDSANLKSYPAHRYVSVATSTLDYNFYDFFNVPYGEWWDLRLSKYGDLPIGSNCFNQVSISDGVCAITNPAIPNAETYPYTDWYPQPAGTGSNSWSHIGNDPLIYAPYRFDAVGVNQQGYNTSEPVFLPVLNYAAAPQATSYVNFDWSMQYLDMSTANYVVNTLKCPLGAGQHFGDDGFMIRSQIDLTLDEHEAGRLFGADTSSPTNYQNFWTAASVPCNAAKGFPSTTETNVENWFSNMGNTKYDIFSSFQYFYSPFYLAISATVDPATLTTHVHIDTSAWGTEVLLARMFYWGNASYAANYLNSAAARGWWGMELAWFEDFHFNGTLVPSGMDFHLNTAMEYHFNELTAPGPDGTLRDSAHPNDKDDVPYWTWGPWLSDYIPASKAHVSELTRYTSPYSTITGYLHSTPGTGTWIYGVNASYEFIPTSWAPKAGEEWHFVFPFGNVKFYNPTTSPQPSNPVSSDYQPVYAPVAFWETRPGSSSWGGDLQSWNQTAWSWDVYGSSSPPAWPCGCTNNAYPWMPYGAVVFLPAGWSTVNPPQVPMPAITTGSTGQSLQAASPASPASDWSLTVMASPDLLDPTRSLRA